MNNIYQELIGGLGNQLLIFLNLISLAKKFNKNIIINNKYKQYNLFSKFYRDNVEDIISNINFIKIVERNYTYESIYLQNNLNYKLIGYFQSYKYFWNNFIDIQENLIIKNIDISNINLKKSIAIHIRLGNYLEKSDFHYNLPYSYYYNLIDELNKNNEYELILFSDNIIKAKNILKNYTFKIADNFFTEEEEQFILMSYCDIIIGSNSTFSLCASYINEIYKFNKNSHYYFPNLWFAHKGPKNNINDLIPDQSNYNIVPIKYKIVALLYHNLKEYIELKNINNLKNQEFIDFDVFELNYSNYEIFLCKNKFDKYICLSKKFKNNKNALAFCLNYLSLKYDFIFNIDLNCEYSNNRFINQVKYFIDNKVILNGYKNDLNEIEMSSICFNSRLLSTFIHENELWTIYDVIEKNNIKIIDPHEIINNKLQLTKKLINQNLNIGIFTKNEQNLNLNNIKYYHYNNNAINFALTECDEIVFYNQIMFYITFYKIKNKYLFYELLDLLENLMQLLYFYKLIIITNNETLKYIIDYKNEYFNIEFVIKEIDEYQLYKFKDNFDNLYENIDFITDYEYFIINLEKHLLIDEIYNHQNYKYYSIINLESIKNVKIIKNCIFKFIKNSFYYLENNFDSYLIPISKKYEFIKNYKNLLFKNDKFINTDQEILKNISTQLNNILMYESLF